MIQGRSIPGVKKFAEFIAPLASLAQNYVGNIKRAIIVFGATISAFLSVLATATVGSPNSLFHGSGWIRSHGVGRITSSPYTAISGISCCNGYRVHD